MKEDMYIQLFYPGAYAPLAMDGNIVVDGVLASCYASSDHDLAHIGMTPVRWFPGMVNWIFGGKNVPQGYVDFANNLGRWLLPQSPMY